MSEKENQPRRKTFPLEIEEKLHKLLKIKAIEEGVTLHTLIIDTLLTRVHEDPVSYRAKPKQKGTAK